MIRPRYRRRRPQKSALVWQTLTAVMVLALTLVLADKYGAERARIQPPDNYGQPIESMRPASALVGDRVGCEIRRFGVAPWWPLDAPKVSSYKEVTYVALRKMGLPDGAAVKALNAILYSRPNEAIAMGRKGGMSTDGQAYSPIFDTSYRHDGAFTVCHASRAGFVNPARREWALLFLVEHEGKTYHVGYFLACNNVSRFYPGEGGDAGVKAEVLALPEPGTLGLMALALGVMVFSNRRKA